MAKKALLIGINRYQIPGSDLRGCVNDVKNLAAALVEFYGFAKADIETLTDVAATKKAMQDGMRKLIKGGRKGDVLVLHYSGHGSNVPDKNGTRRIGGTRSSARPTSTGRPRSSTTGCAGPWIRRGPG